MISQRCPKCHSNRIRRGYRPTPIWSKLIFRYNLLCDSCNWEFTGFAVPGTVSAKPPKKHKKRSHRSDSMIEPDGAKDNGEKNRVAPQMVEMEGERTKKTFVL